MWHDSPISYPQIPTGRHYLKKNADQNEKQYFPSVSAGADVRPVNLVRNATERSGFGHLGGIHLTLAVFPVVDDRRSGSPDGRPPDERGYLIDVQQIVFVPGDGFVFVFVDRRLKKFCEVQFGRPEFLVRALGQNLTLNRNRWKSINIHGTPDRNPVPQTGFSSTRAK